MCVIDAIDVPRSSYYVLEIRGLFPFLSVRNDGIMHEIMELQLAEFVAFIVMQDA